MIDKYKLKKILNNGFHSALKFTDEGKFKDSNSLKSAKFVSIISESIFNEFYNNSGNNLNVIKVDGQGNKDPGEWLLDACITQNTIGFKKKIILAMESESDTSLKAFNDDFAKLIHIKAENYIYLNGLNQKTNLGNQKYINNRLLYAQQLMNPEEFSTFFIAFWASPKKIRGFESIWSAINDGELEHLKEVYLYEYSDGIFCKV